jgi:signal peptidase I
MCTLVTGLRRLGRLLATVAMVAAVAFLLAVGVGPRTGAYRTLTVLTGSMRPTIPPGALIVVTPSPAADVRVGQVITFQAPVEGKPVVTHRVIEVVEGGDRPVIRTQGDANEAADPWVARVEGGTVWEVRHVVPGVGRVVSELRAPAVHRALVLVVPLALAALWLVDIWRPRPLAAATPTEAAPPARVAA